MGESLVNLANRPWFTKLKPSKLVLSINNLLADLLLHQTVFCQMLEKSQFAKLSCYTVWGINCLSPTQKTKNHRLYPAATIFDVQLQIRQITNVNTVSLWTVEDSWYVGYYSYLLDDIFKLPTHYEICISYLPTNFAVTYKRIKSHISQLAIAQIYKPSPYLLWNHYQL